MGLREALLKDGRGLLENLYTGSEVSVPEAASRPGEKRHPERKLELHTIFGKVEIFRSYYYCPATRTGRFPLDEALGLVQSFSPALVRLAARAAAREGYEAASEDLADLANIQIEGRQIHRLVNYVAPQVSEALKEGLIQDTEPIPVVYVEVDGTGVPMVSEELEGRPGKQADGTSKTREVKLGCVFSQTRADPETGLPLRDPNSTSYVGSFENSQQFGGRIRHEALRRGVDRAGKVVLVGDGAAWIWELARQNFPEAIEILDFYHVLERLHDLCMGLYPPPSHWAPRMEERWKEMLKKDQVDQVIAAAHRRLGELGDSKDRKLEKQIAYFENHRSRMLYQTYRKQGLFYGSGVVEAGCRAVIGQRLKESGMFWSEPGATSILQLRCVLKGHRWDECWNRINSCEPFTHQTAA